MSQLLKISSFTLAGALVLIALSALQKLIVGVPMAMASFIVPLIFGALSGALIGWLYLNLKQQIIDLGDQQHLLNDLFTAIPDIMVLKDRDSVYKLVNQPFCQFLGLSEDQIIGKTDFDLFPEEEAKQYRKDDAAIMASGEAIMQDEEVTSPNGKMWLQVAKTPLKDEQGQTTGLLISVRDISARKKTENELSATRADLEQRVIERTRDLMSKEQEMSAIIENLPSMIFVKDARELRFVRFNRAGEELLGMSRDQLMGRNDYDFFPEEQADFFTGKDRKVLETGEIEDIAEEPIETPHGTRLLHTRKVCISNDDGEPQYLLGISEDITERKQVEEKLQEREYLYRSLIETTYTGYLVLDTSGKVIDANNEYIRQTGHQSLEEIIGRSVVDWTARHDRERNASEVARCLQQGYVRDLQIDYVHTDGSILPIEVNARMVDTGQGQRILALCRDISERRQAEKALVASSQRYESVLASTKDGFCMVDLQGQILEVNQAYCQLSGYSREELLGMNIAELDARQDGPRVQDTISRVSEKGSILFESEHRQKNGSIWPVEVSISYSPLQGGRLYGFMRDISERKLAEALTRLHQKLSELLYTGDHNQLLRAALATAEKLTQSKIGFYHFVENDQETISLQTWSTRTLKEMCFAEGDGLHYPVSEAGVWVDCVLQRQPVIHNDYESLPHKKGLPEGHAPLLRELTVPVFRDGLIVAVMGVGNKPIDYVEGDVAIATRIADQTFDFIERKKAEQQIQFMAYNDVLTGLPNRSLFSDRLQQAARLAHRSDGQLAICYLDLDGFKPVNDHFGHQVGDQLLVMLAQRLKKELRDGDTLARLGGDEFVVLLNELPTIYSGEEIVQRILSNITEPFEINAQRIHISASIGVTFYPQDDEDPDTLLRHADQAMYKAKGSGKNTYRLYDPIQDEKVHAHRHAVNEFSRALHNEELLLYFQPRIELKGGKISGVEALIRWQHPQRGLLAPAAFLPMIEGTPQEIALDEWVIKHALNQHMKWREQGLVMPVSINISPRHIQQSDFPDFLANALASYPKDIADNLELEILETSAIGDTSRVSDIMNACARLGVHFSLDDFGTGYSSLTYFHRLPISILKIDQHFVRDMIDDSRDQDIVEGVIRLAEALDRPVVAEGVENIELALMLLQLGCKYAQGYGIAKPMPEHEMITWTEQWQQQSQWQNLEQVSREFSGEYDLNVAIFTHQRWLDAVSNYIHQVTDSSLPQLNEEKCEFTHWYKGIGSVRFGQKPIYAFILAKHAEAHRLAKDLVAMADSGKRQQAIDGLQQLKAIGEELIAMLVKLEGD